MTANNAFETDEMRAYVLRTYPPPLNAVVRSVG